MSADELKQAALEALAEQAIVSIHGGRNDHAELRARVSSPWCDDGSSGAKFEFDLELAPAPEAEAAPPPPPEEKRGELLPRGLRVLATAAPNGK